jgi:hypothetical protein
MQPTKALIGEAGPEAVVPLPDGRTIPVSFDASPLSGLGDVFKDMKIDLNGNNGMTELTAKMDQMITAMKSSTQGTAAGGTDAIAEAFNGFQNMMAKQLGVHEEMAVHAKDNKDLLDKLLKVSM